MSNYEIVLKGFDGSTDETDHMVLWIRAANIRVIAEALMPVLEKIVAIELLGDTEQIAQNIDFSLPEDIEEVKLYVLENGDD